MDRMSVQIGMEFGFLKITKDCGVKITPGGGKHRIVLCECSCGNEKEFYLSNIKAGRTVSCGCHNDKNRFLINVTHGAKKTRTYRIWAAMKQRCYNPRGSFWKHYGGRGIKVCERWRSSFENFLEDMGHVPDGYSIDRIDVNGNYEPSNCRWANMKDQQNNRRNNKRHVFHGAIVTISEISDLTGISYENIAARIRRGWSVERAAETPVLKVT